MAQTVMTEEDRTELEKAGAASPQALSHEPHVFAPGPSTTNDPASKRQSMLSSPTPSNGGKSSPSKDGKEKDKKRNRLTPEQRKKLQEIEDERRRSMEERVKMLTGKLTERLRPFVDAKAPGDRNDPETKAFEAKIRNEADDLKIESFGVEVCAAGVVFIDLLSPKSTAVTHNWNSIYHEGDVIFKVEEVLGDVSGAIIGPLFPFTWRSAGFWSRMKEKGSIAKDAWGVIGSAFVFHLYCPFHTFTAYVK